MPLLYLLTGVLNRILSLAAGVMRRQLSRNAALPTPRILPPPIRLLILAFAIRWLVSKVPLPLLAREFWSTTALMIAVVACMWLLMLSNSWAERYLVEHRRSLSGAASALRLVRRVIDGLVLFAGLLFTLNHFGINLTATLAGLGVGGIAVALAAQKTLENVIAGVSLIVDQAVRVGDILNLGDIQGTVVEVGLRSTRIRTVDRTIVSLPNGQIANMRLETLSARDRFLFHPVVGLRYETTPVQLRAFMASVRTLLSEHVNVDPVSMRVRFVRFGPSSLEVDIFAYVFASDGNNFLEIQEELLLGIMDIVQQAGAGIALPSQTLYLANDKSDKPTQPIRDYGERNKADALH
jgi:MscS family membrane protein